MTETISTELRNEAIQAFLAYEKLVVTRLLGRPDWRLAADPVEKVLATGDVELVREFIADLHRASRDLETAVIVQGG